MNMPENFSAALRSIGSDATEIDIMVTPNAKSASVGSVDPWRKRLIVKVQDMPLEGKANNAVEALLKNFFGVPVEILKGHTDRHKTVLVHQGIEGVTALLVENERLNRCSGKS